MQYEPTVHTRKARISDAVSRQQDKQKIQELIGGAIVSFPFRKYLKTEKTAEGSKYDTYSYRYLRTRSDRYSKRLLNSTALMFALVFIFIFSEIFFCIFGNSKSAEFTENAFKNSIAVEIPAFILLNNILCLRIFQRRIRLPDKPKFKRHIVGITVFSAVWSGRDGFHAYHPEQIPPETIT